MRVLARIVGVVGLGMLTGCAFARPIAKDAVSYNETLAHAQSEVLLLNIARASMKHPLFFTSVSEVSRTMSSKSGVGFDIPFGGGSDDKYVGKPYGEVSGGPTATIAVHDSEKFMRGITTPLAPETFAYYWNQGWPKEVLLALCVRRFDEAEDAPIEGKLYRMGDETAEDVRVRYRKFQRRLAMLAKYQAVEVDVAPSDPAMLATATSGSIKASDLIAAAKEGMKLTPSGKDAVKIIGKGGVKRLRFTDPVGAGGKRTDEKSMTLVAAAEGGSRQAEGNALYLRSVEAMIYHVGEMVRLEQDLPVGEYPVTVFKRRAPLFSSRAAPRACDCDCLLRVQYCGRTIEVSPRPEDGESMHVLSLLSQFLALHKSADELPRGGVVTLVGG